MREAGADAGNGHDLEPEPGPADVSLARGQGRRAVCADGRHSPECLPCVDKGGE